MWSSSNVNSDKIKYRLLQLKRGRKTYFTTQTGGLLRHLAGEMKKLMERSLHNCYFIP